MADWYEYAVTTRTGPGAVERPEGEGWELVHATSTPPPAPERGPLASLVTQSRAEHHAWWKRKKRQEHAPLVGKIEVTEEKGGRVERRTV